MAATISWHRKAAGAYSTGPGGEAQPQGGDNSTALGGRSLHSRAGGRCRHADRVDWLRAWDLKAFRWINREWSGPTVDGVMQWCSGNRAFVPLLVVSAIVLLWGTGRRGLVLIVALGLAAALANEFLVEPLKDGVQRPRPYVVLDDAILRVGRGNPVGSMPSAHALNMALIATVAGVFFRRSLWVLAPLALLVGWSRVYNGAHFPSDVLAGWLLGSGFGLGFVLVMDRLWRLGMPRWLPGVARWLPGLLEAPPTWKDAPMDARQTPREERPCGS